MSERKDAVDAMVGSMIAATGRPKDIGFTLGWDVVVSYSEVEINKLLRERYQKADTKIVKHIIASTQLRDNRTRKMFTRKYKFLLSAPEIQFHGAATTGPACDLSMTILKTSFTDELSNGKIDDPVELDDDAFRISIKGIKLGSVTGNYSEIVKGTKKVDIVPSATTIDFPKDETHTSWVVLNLPISVDNLNITVTAIGPSSKDLEMDANDIQGVMGAFFRNPENVDTIEYSLASVNNQSDKDRENELKPNSFRFGTFTASYQATSILSLFIHCSAGQDSGQKNDLQSSWAGQWADHKISPIPKGYTASIIMNPNLVYLAMLQPGFAKNGFRTTKGSDIPKLEGIDITASMNKTINQGPYKYAYNKYSQLETSGYSVDLLKFPMTLQLKQTNPGTSPVMYIKWTVEIETDWNDITNGKNPILDLGTRTRWDSYKLKTTYVIDRDFDCDSTLTDEMFSLSIDTSPKDPKKPTWQVSFDKTTRENEILRHVTIDTPTEVLDTIKSWLTGLAPKFTITGLGLGFFRTTNLLFPGKKVINIDQSIGIRVPKDLLLVGDLVENID